MEGFPREYLRAFDEVAKRARQEPVLIGAGALLIYGSPRLTHDLDILSTDLNETLEALYFSGFKVVESRQIEVDGATTYSTYPGAKAALYALGLHGRRACKCIHVETELELDVWFESPAGLTLSADEIVAQSIIYNGLGTPVRVATLAHIKIMKEEALKENPKRMTDRMDIEMIDAILTRSPGFP